MHTNTRFQSLWRLLAGGVGLLACCVFVIVVAMMVRSYFYEDSIVCVTQQERAHMATSCHGKVFYQGSNAFAYPHTDVQSVRVTDERAGLVSWGDESPTFCDLTIRTEAFQFPALRGGMMPGEVNIILPYWLLSVLTGVWPAVLAVRKVRGKRRPPSFPVSSDRQAASERASSSTRDHRHHFATGS